MPTRSHIHETVAHIVGQLLSRSGKTAILAGSTNLQEAGLTSEDGVEIACDLEARLGIRVPAAFNPLIHENGRRMLTLSELQARVTELAVATTPAQEPRDA